MRFERPQHRGVIWKPYKTPNKKENWLKSFPEDDLWISGKGVLYGHSDSSGVLYGNHINIVGQQVRGTIDR